MTLLGAAGVATRLWATAASLEGWDGADFALSLHDYDLRKQQPHFPGYPVYVAAARAARLIVNDDVAALALPGALAAGAGAIAAFTLAGVGAACLFIAAPGLWLLGGKAQSDGTALGLLLVVYALARARPGLSGLAAGLLLGVRMAYAPALLGWLWLVRSAGKRASIGIIAGIVLWAVPLATLVGPVDLVQIGFAFTKGHFETWGGAMGYGSLGQRALAHSWSLAVFHLGVGSSLPRIVATVALACALALAVRRSSPRARAALLCATPYALWILLAQNPDRPRHTAPLAGAIAIAAGAAAIPALIAASAMTVSALPLVGEQRSNPAPNAALAQTVAAHYPANTRVYGWEEVRLFSVYGSHIDARRAYSLDDIDTAGATTVLFTSNLRAKRRDQHCFEPVATFRGSPLIFRPTESITLFRYCGQR